MARRCKAGNAPFRVNWSERFTRSVELAAPASLRGERIEASTHVVRWLLLRSLNGELRRRSWPGPSRVGFPMILPFSPEVSALPRFIPGSMPTGANTVTGSGLAAVTHSWIECPGSCGHQLTSMPSIKAWHDWLGPMTLRRLQAEVKAFRGRNDHVWPGVPCARSWVAKGAA